MSKVSVFAFKPLPGKTTKVANSATATAQVVLPVDSETVSLFNSSASATTFVRITEYLDTSTVPADATANAPTTSVDFPVPPLAQIRIGCNVGGKIIRTIASAADGSIYITPGMGS